MDIRKIGDVKCSAGPRRDCGNCESCIMQRKLAMADECLSRVSEAKKQTYIRSLLQRCNSVEIISSLVGLLEPLMHKDFIYAKSKVNATFDKDLVNMTNLSNRSMDITTVESYMLDDMIWFSSASSWAKLNYLLYILKLCNSFTLENVVTFLKNQYEILRKQALNKSHSGLVNEEGRADIEITVHDDQGIFYASFISFAIK